MAFLMRAHPTIVSSDYDWKDQCESFSLLRFYYIIISDDAIDVVSLWKFELNIENWC